MYWSYKIRVFENFFPIPHRHISKSKWSYYVYWVTFKITTLCSSLFETRISYTTYISGMNDSFNNKSRYLAKPIYGNDARVLDVPIVVISHKCVRGLDVPLIRKGTNIILCVTLILLHFTFLFIIRSSFIILKFFKKPEKYDTSLKLI